VKTTTNYGLKKPETNDHYNIDDFNEAFDSIDTELKTVSDKANTAAEHLSDTNNPHKTTAAQVGLGNVPNVTTNDQTPTYTPASANAALASGEKLSVAFGKIAKATNSLISHLADTVGHITSTERATWNAKLDSSSTASKATADASGNNIANTYATKTTVTSHTGNVSNPHKVTAAQIGAVPASETSSFNFTNKSLNTVNIDEVTGYNYITAISESGHGTVPINNWLNVVNLWSMHFVTQIAFTCLASATANRSVQMWIRERYMNDIAGWTEWKLVHNASTITAGTTDLTAGTSPLETGHIYIVYE